MTDEHTESFETGEDQQMSDRLRTAAPVPAAGFRGALGRYLRRRDPGYGPRPTSLRLMSASCLLAGAVLLFVGALQATGAL